MRLGISSYTYVWAVGVPGFEQPARPMTHRELLDKAAALGVHVVQFADHLPLDRLPPAELDALKAHADERAIEIEGGTSGIAPDHLRRQLDVAARVGARLIRTVTDTATHRPSPEECVALLREIAPECERRGITVALENHDRFKAATLRKIVEDVGSARIGICLDTANSLGCSEGSETVLETLGPVTSCLHIKDYTARRLPHRFGFLVEGAPAGSGDLDVPHWIERLRELGREFNVIIELWPAPEPTLAGSIEKEARWAERSVVNLRRLVKE